MRLLLDTTVILWWLDDAPQLSEEAKRLLDHADTVHISAVSPWEITFKQHLGLLEGPGDLAERVRVLAFTSLPVTAAHGVRAGDFPWFTRTPSTGSSSPRRRPTTSYSSPGATGSRSTT